MCSQGKAVHTSTAKHAKLDAKHHDLITTESHNAAFPPRLITYLNNKGGDGEATLQLTSESVTHSYDARLTATSYFTTYLN